jgi:hypothetical protein
MGTYLCCIDIWHIYLYIQHIWHISMLYSTCTMGTDFLEFFSPLRLLFPLHLFILALLYYGHWLPRISFFCFLAHLDWSESGTWVQSVDASYNLLFWDVSKAVKGNGSKVCIYTQTHTDTHRRHTHTCIYTSIYIYIYIYTGSRTNIHTCIHIYIYTCMCVCVSVCVCACVCVCVCVYREQNSNRTPRQRTCKQSHGLRSRVPYHGAHILKSPYSQILLLLLLLLSSLDIDCLLEI